MDASGFSRKKLIFRFIILILSVIAGYNLSEFVLKQMAYRKLKEACSIQQFFEADKILGWKGRNNAKGWFKEKEVSRISFVSLNSRGFRGEDFHYPRRKKNRLVILGDSFTWGYGVNQDEMMSRYLKELLGKDWEIINLSVFGYSTDQELILLEREGIKYKPDLVLLFFFAGNDFGDNSKDKVYNRYKPFFELEKDKKLLQKSKFSRLSWKRRISTSLKESSYTYLLLRKLLGRDDTKNLSEITSLNFTDDFTDYNISLSFQIIKRMNEFLAKKKTRFLVIIVPTQEQVYSWSAPFFPKQYGRFNINKLFHGNNELKRMLKAEKINYFDLTEPLQSLSIEYAKEKKKRFVYNISDLHWSVLGNKEVANLLEVEIKRLINN